MSNRCSSQMLGASHCLKPRWHVYATLSLNGLTPSYHFGWNTWLGWFRSRRYSSAEPDVYVCPQGYVCHTSLQTVLKSFHSTPLQIKSVMILIMHSLIYSISQDCNDHNRYRHQLNVLCQVKSIAIKFTKSFRVPFLPTIFTMAHRSGYWLLHEFRNSWVVVCNTNAGTTLASNRFAQKLFRHSHQATSSMSP